MVTRLNSTEVYLDVQWQILSNFHPHEIAHSNLNDVCIREFFWLCILMYKKNPVEQNHCSHVRTCVWANAHESNSFFSQMFFSPRIVASADIFSCPWRGFLSQETLHFNLVRRGIILSKFEFYLRNEFVPFLHHICYSEAENVCLSFHLEGIHILLSLYHQFYRCLPVFMPLVCLLPLTLDACLWLMSAFIVAIKVLDSRIYFIFLSLPCFFYLSNCVFFPLSLFLQT